MKKIEDYLNASSKVQKADIVLQGDMTAHSDIVNQLLPFTESGFASCSNDGLVILWKVFRAQHKPK